MMNLHDYCKSEYNTDELKYAAATKRIREGRTLPNVSKVESFGRFYVLHVIEAKK